MIQTSGNNEISDFMFVCAGVQFVFARAILLLFEYSGKKVSVSMRKKKELPFCHSSISPSGMLSSVDIRKMNLLDVTLNWAS